MPERDDIASVLATIDVLQRKLTELRKGIYRDIQTGELPEGRADLLSCRVGRSVVALPLDRVQSVVLRCSLTPVPEAPSWVAGLLDFRGEVVPVLDLHTRLNRESLPPSLRDVILVCRDGERRAGFVAQAIGAVHFDAALEPTDDLHEVPHAPYVMAVAHLDGAAAVVLSMGRLLAALELVEIEAS